MSTTPNADEVTDSQPATGQLPLPGLAALALPTLGLVLVVCTVLMALVYFVPDGNDYPQATLLKHARLGAADDKPKLVFVGGSSLAYGLDSEMVERATGRHVVNMGMNGFLGVRYMLEEVKAALVEGDAVVLSFEYDNYYKTVEGAGKDLLMIAKTRPEAFSHLNVTQLLEVLEMTPYAAQKKLLRLVSELFRGIKGQVQAEAGGAAEPMSSDELVAAVETLSGFNAYGDLISHLDVDWRYERESGIDLTARGIDPEVVALMQGFGDEMKRRGVSVFVFYCPLLRTFHEKHRGVIDEFHRRLTVGDSLAVPVAPEGFVYDASLFFDTVYHLNRRGRALRSRKLAGIVAPLLQGHGASL